MSIVSEGFARFHCSSVPLIDCCADPQRFNHFDGYADVKQNQSLNISLEATAYPMPITYVWYHPTGRQLYTDQSKVFVNQGQLSLMNIQKSDMGVYRCMATNSFGSDSVNFTLNVLCE